MYQLSEGLFLYNNFIEKSWCSNLVAKLEKSTEWQDSKVFNRYGQPTLIPTIRKQKCLKNFCQEELQEFCNICYDLKHILNIKCELEPHLLEYQISEIGGHFDWHPDFYQNSGRIMSVLLYLNDKNTHGLDGGLTEFICGDEIIAVEPNAGSAVIFDPKLVHRGTEVLSGVKYSILGIHKENSEAIVRELACQNE